MNAVGEFGELLWLMRENKTNCGARAPALDLEQLERSLQYLSN